jgi:hypothetical protein
MHIGLEEGPEWREKQAERMLSRQRIGQGPEAKRSMLESRNKTVATGQMFAVGSWTGTVQIACQNVPGQEQVLFRFLDGDIEVRVVRGMVSGQGLVLIAEKA